MTSYRLQSSYSSTVTLHGWPVVLRPVRATPCYYTRIVRHTELHVLIMVISLTVYETSLSILLEISTVM